MKFFKDMALLILILAIVIAVLHASAGRTASPGAMILSQVLSQVSGEVSTKVLEPVIGDKTEVVLTTPDTFLPQDYAFWDNLILVLKSGEIKSLVLNVRGQGGSIDKQFAVSRAIEDAQKQGIKIHMNVIGPAYSAHAFLTCYVDKKDLTIEPGAGLMFHQAYGFGDFIFGLISYKSTSLDPLQQNMINYTYKKCIENGELTQLGVDSVNAGKEIYIVMNAAGQLEQSSTKGSTRNVPLIDSIIHLALDVLFVLSIVAALGYINKKTK